ncbi:hypothetical protein R1flu_015797 [Riccia fluitans]|uniref:VCBS repeat-containing protein n=1 Tax=Riccia fluitans TaxID=41844 RepID=A0ABD1YJZ5_9MARC
MYMLQRIKMKSFYVLAIFSLLFLIPRSAAVGGNKLEVGIAKLRSLATFNIDRPAFITSFPNADKHDLVISSFGVEINPFNPNPDKVRYIPDVGAAISSANFAFREIKDSVLWPNEVSLLNGEDVLVPGGFLIPWKNPGHISTMKLKDFRENYDKAKWKQLVKDTGNAYFHRVQPVNVYGNSFRNSSGVRMVSCRGRKPIFSFFQKAGGEMVFLEPKEGGDGFDVQVIKEGCDTFFRVVDLNKDGIPEFIIPQFYTEYLVLMWTEEETGDYTKPEFIRTRFIDTQIGKAFDVQLVDLDLDGQLEILATNHQNKVEKPRPELVSYKMDLPKGSVGTVSDFMNGIVFDKVLLSEDFELMDSSSNAGSPAAVTAVKPGPYNSAEFPAIVVSGDGSFKAYLLTRNSDGEYTQEIFHDCEGTVGAIHVKDVDGDGWKEVFVPCYDTNYVAVYTFRPSELNEKELAI